MKLFKLFGTIGMAAAFIGLVAACSSSDSGGGTTPAGSGCSGFCAKPTAAKCYSSAKACTDSCNTSATTYASCKAKWDAVLSCGSSSKATITCSGSAANINGCDAETTALLACLAGDGGVGGGGNGGSGGSATGGGAGEGGTSAGGTGTGGAGTGGTGTGGTGTGGTGTGGTGTGGTGTGGTGTGGTGTGGTAGGGTGGSAATLALPASCAAVDKVGCVPNTNEGCTVAGAACDYAGDTQEFVCFDPPNTEVEGAACDNSQGPYCTAKLSCVALTDGDGGLLSATCEKWCCADTDCTAPKKCAKYDATGGQNYGSLGRCQ